MSDALEQSQPDEVLGHYQLGIRLARGSWADVYRGIDLMTRREVVLKIARFDSLDDILFRRFQREAQLLAQLEHPAIVPLYAFECIDNRHFMVMRYMPGGTLADRLGAEPTDITAVVALLDRIGSALDYAHQRGIVHRDIKPSNILFDRADLPYLADFGIAHLAEAAVDLTGTRVIGTPHYMAPEQARSEDVDARTDVYALGILTFELLTGRVPFTGSTPISVLLKHLTEMPLRPSTLRRKIPVILDDVILSALAKNPAARPASVSRFVEEFRCAAKVAGGA